MALQEFNFVLCPECDVPIGPEYLALAVGGKSPCPSCDKWLAPLLQTPLEFREDVKAIKDRLVRERAERKAAEAKAKTAAAVEAKTVARTWGEFFGLIGGR
jgi:hypothetical protein